MAFTAGQILRASQLGPVPCTSTTRPASPHEGLLITESDTGMLAIWRSGAWRYVASDGTVATAAEYNASSGQSINQAFNIFVAFGTANYTTPLVTQGVTGDGHFFRLQRAGLWAISTTVRWASTNIAGERYNEIRIGGGIVGSQGGLIGAGTAPITHNISVMRFISASAAGTASADVDVRAFQISDGGARTLEANNGSGWCRINLSWIRP